MWLGKTVAIVTALATLDQRQSVAGLACVAVRRACFVMPDADMLVSIDGPNRNDPSFWSEAAAFAGIKVCGVECAVEARYVNLPHERVQLAPGHEIEFRNNGLFAMRIAARAGAARLVLVGFDTARYEARYRFRGLTQGLAALIAELRGQGVEVVIHG
jgi:hypothetical protein